MIIQKLHDQIRGYKEKTLNLNEFIQMNCLDMILNNTIIEELEFELYNYEKLYYDNIEDLTAEVKDEIKEVNAGKIELKDTSYLNEMLINTNYTLQDVTDNINLLLDEIKIYEDEYIYLDEVYQYFIIPERDALQYWDKYTNYPIYYNADIDIYLLGITHYGMSWSYFNTDYQIKEYF